MTYHIGQTKQHQSRLKPADNKFHKGNESDGKHYWLTPPELYESLDAEFQVKKQKTMSTYSEHLKNPKWQKKRLDILNRDHFRCRCCTSPDKTLHVHHMYYIKGWMPWEYEDDSLITLCENCHENVGRYDWQRAFMDLNLTPDQLLEMAMQMRFYMSKQRKAHTVYKEKSGSKYNFNPSDHYAEPWVAILENEDELHEYYRDFSPNERPKYITD